MATILAVLEHLSALLGARHGPPRRPCGALGCSRSGPGVPRERSWETSWRSWGALTWGHPVAPDPSRD